MKKGNKGHVNRVLFSVSKIIQYCKNIFSLWPAASSMFIKPTVLQLVYWTTSCWSSKNHDEKKFRDVFLFFFFFLETRFEHDLLKTKMVCMCWSCVVVQVVSIFCTVSSTTSSFKGTTSFVRTGVVPGRYLYFIFLGQRYMDKTLKSENLQCAFKADFKTSSISKSELVDLSPKQHTKCFTKVR